MYIGIYTKGNQINKTVIQDMDNFRDWCKQYKPKEVWILDTESNKIAYHFTIETEVIIKEL